MQPRLFELHSTLSGLVPNRIALRWVWNVFPTMSNSFHLPPLILPIPRGATELLISQVLRPLTCNLLLRGWQIASTPHY